MRISGRRGSRGTVPRGRRSSPRARTCFRRVPGRSAHVPDARPRSSRPRASPRQSRSGSCGEAHPACSGPKKNGVPSVAISTMLGRRGATIGACIAMASRIDSGCPSDIDVDTKASTAPSSSGTSRRGPRNTTRSPSPSRACCALRSASRGPSPASKITERDDFGKRATAIEQVGVPLLGVETKLRKSTRRQSAGHPSAARFAARSSRCRWSETRPMRMPL